jgi:transposase InsO family protein
MRERGEGRSVEELSRLFGYSRQHYYQQLKRLSKRALQEESILSFVRSERSIQKSIGTIKLQKMWNAQFGVEAIGRDALFSLLGRHNLLIRRSKRYRPKQTDGNGLSIYPDLRKGLKVCRPNHLWCSDTTYIDMNNSHRHAYLTYAVDEYSHKVLGHTVDYRMRDKDILVGIQRAVQSELSPEEQYFTEELILHTDRAGVFKSKLYEAFTDRYAIKRSMSRAGKSHENPVAERLNGILKNELMIQSSFDTLAEARQAIAQAIKIYNERRPHLSCDLRTPCEAHTGQGVLKKLWRQRKNNRSVKTNQE